MSSGRTKKVSISIPRASVNPVCLSSDNSPAQSDPSVAAIMIPQLLITAPVLTIALRAASASSISAGSWRRRVTRKML